MSLECNTPPPFCILGGGSKRGASAQREVCLWAAKQLVLNEQRGVFQSCRRRVVNSDLIQTVTLDGHTTEIKILHHRVTGICHHSNVVRISHNYYLVKNTASAVAVNSVNTNGYLNNTVY